MTTRSVDRLIQLRRGGAWPLVDLAATHVLYFVAFGAVAGLRPFAAVVVYLMFTYLAPTPGGAGFAEAMAIPFFGPLLPAADAVMFVLCFRGLTLYLQVGVGVPYLLFAGGMREIVTRAARRDE